MEQISKYILAAFAFLFISCHETETYIPDLDPSVIQSLEQYASRDGFQPYENNPIIDIGPKGSFDAGALGSMSVLLVDGVFHVYYETWGVRS
jgi:hypothetical protein